MEIQSSSNDNIIVIEDDRNYQANYNDKDNTHTLNQNHSTHNLEMSVSGSATTTQSEDLVDIIRESLVTEQTVSEDTLLKLTKLPTEHGIKQVFVNLSEALNDEGVAILGKALCLPQIDQLHNVIKFYFRYLLLPKVG